MTIQHITALKSILAQSIWAGCCIAIVIAVFVITNTMPDTPTTHAFTVFEFAVTMGYALWSMGPLNRVLDKIEGKELS